jgi:hypothetical protein
MHALGGRAMNITFCYSATGSPVLITNTGKRSSPVSYQSIAQLKVGEKIFVGFGDYYDSEFIKPGVVYRLIEQVE